MPGGIRPVDILGLLNVAAGRFRLDQAAAYVWREIAEALHAGVSKDAGFRADAVARLMETVADQLPGNSELPALAFRIAGRKGPAATAAASIERIFLSYASHDRAEVDQLHDGFKRKRPGLQVFQDHRSIALGTRWLDAIRAAAGGASVLVCWVTDAFLKSAFCSYEIGLASANGVTVVPVFVKPSLTLSLPAYLAEQQGLSINNNIEIDMVVNNLWR